MTEPLLNIEQVEAWWDVNAKWIYARTYTGELPHLKVGGLLRFRESELLAYLEDCERGQRPHRLTQPPRAAPGRSTRTAEHRPAPEPAA